MIFKAFMQLKKIQQVLGWTSGGIYKRIDENRELLELLLKEAPDLIGRRPEVVHWIAAQDEFLMDLVSTIPPKTSRFDPREGLGKDRGFPRPWPAECGVWVTKR